MSWYESSIEFIQEQKLANPDMPHSELRKHCSEHYPFAERRGAAYKSFLRAMREQFGATRVKKTPEQFDLLDSN